jgi:hypothetical protein
MGTVGQLRSNAAFKASHLQVRISASIEHLRLDSSQLRRDDRRDFRWLFAPPAAHALLHPPFHPGPMPVPLRSQQLLDPVRLRNRKQPVFRQWFSAYTAKAMAPAVDDGMAFRTALFSLTVNNLPDERRLAERWLLAKAPGFGVRIPSELQTCGTHKFLFVELNALEPMKVSLHFCNRSFTPQSNRPNQRFS